MSGDRSQKGQQVRRGDGGVWLGPQEGSTRKVLACVCRPIFLLLQEGRKQCELCCSRGMAPLSFIPLLTFSCFPPHHMHSYAQYEKKSCLSSCTPPPPAPPSSPPSSSCCVSSTRPRDASASAWASEVGTGPPSLVAGAAASLPPLLRNGRRRNGGKCLRKPWAKPAAATTGAAAARSATRRTS